MTDRFWVRFRHLDVPMQRRHVVLALGLISPLLTACVENSPIMSGEIHPSGGQARPLSDRQVALLNSWIDVHRSGWSDMVLATPPQEDLSVMVRLHVAA
jgi:hypothetical protein